MGLTVAEKIISKHITEGEITKSSPISIEIDQTLTQDATGTMAYLEFEAMGIPRVKTEVSVSYVDHNLLQSDFRNPDDHLFLQSIAKKYGIYFSKPGNGICHQVHLERFACPGKTLLGSDSHTPTCGGMGMIAMGAGGLDVAMAMAGIPFNLIMPKIIGVKLTSSLQPWVSARDVILELLRRLTVKGGVGKIFEYFGEGVKTLTVPERATICNLGAELGATTSIFPSDEMTKKFLVAQDREKDWQELIADNDAQYNEIIEIDLSQLEPLIACPSAPDKVQKVSDVAGQKVSQVIVGSCANSSYYDLAMVSNVLQGRSIHGDVSFEINPGSKQVLENLEENGLLKNLIKAGSRIHQSGCLGCIGMGQAPATDSISLRTVTRNFPGRSGTKNDQVYLCSPQTAVASALSGKITDPKDLGAMPEVELPEKFVINDNMIVPPSENADIKIIRGPNIKPLPEFDPLPEEITATVLLKVGDNITTDHIMPAGSHILPLRSNIPSISQYVFNSIDPEFPQKALAYTFVAILGGENYGQGSSREHAALAPRYLHVRIKIAKSFARIHKANLINFGIIPLTLSNPDDYDKIALNSTINIKNIRTLLLSGANEVSVAVNETDHFTLNADFSERDRKILAAGGLLSWARLEIL